MGVPLEVPKTAESEPAAAACVPTPGRSPSQAPRASAGRPQAAMGPRKILSARRRRRRRRRRRQGVRRC